MAAQTVSLELLVMLGSAIVHAEEALSADGHPADVAAFNGIVQDPLVQQWLKEMRESALLPVKR